jgi:hypothetical protein
MALKMALLLIWIVAPCEIVGTNVCKEQNCHGHLQYMFFPYGDRSNSLPYRTVRNYFYQFTLHAVRI